MKIVIDIPEDVYTRLFDNDIQDNEIATDDICEMARSLRLGTSLPKGHGDLIDRSTLEPDTEWSDWDDGWISYSYGQIADADVVIKADGGGEDAVGN